MARFKTSGTTYFEGRTFTNYRRGGAKNWASRTFRKTVTNADLLLDSDLEENSILGVHYRPPVTAGGFLNSSVIETRTKEIIERFRRASAESAIDRQRFSGGNQQKLIIGSEFELNPKLLLVSQPTRGVDIGAIEFIHRKLIALRDAGTRGFVGFGGTRRSNRAG